MKENILHYPPGPNDIIERGETYVITARDMDELLKQWQLSQAERVVPGKVERDMDQNKSGQRIGKVRNLKNTVFI